jgi:hypothetical protein
MVNIKIIIMFFIIVSLLILFIYNKNESFVTDLSIVDPYSLFLHKDISDKEDWWHRTHTAKFYYYHDMVPIHYRE